MISGRRPQSCSRTCSPSLANCHVRGAWGCRVPHAACEEIFGGGAGHSGTLQLVTVVLCRAPATPVAHPTPTHPHPWSCRCAARRLQALHARPAAQVCGHFQRRRAHGGFYHGATACGCRAAPGSWAPVGNGRVRTGCGLAADWAAQCMACTGSSTNFPSHTAQIKPALDAIRSLGTVLESSLQLLLPVLVRLITPGASAAPLMTQDETLVTMQEVLPKMQLAGACV